MEFERLFTLFGDNVKDSGMCLGKTYYNPKTEVMEVSGRSTVNKFWTVPLIIVPSHL
jgi:hypothetical protein